MLAIETTSDRPAPEAQIATFACCAQRLATRSGFNCGVFATTITLLANKPMNAEYLIEQAMMIAYRWAGYALLNWADDAAMLALVFC